MAVGHVHAALAVQVLPLRFEFAVAVEDLDAVVLALGDIDPAIGVGADVVDDVELAPPVLGSPNDISNLPSGEYLCIRELP
jgi:hypothetical protein